MQMVRLRTIGQQIGEFVLRQAKEAFGLPQRIISIKADGGY
jgi:hypothetical protein